MAGLSWHVLEDRQFHRTPAEPATRQEQLTIVRHPIFGWWFLFNVGDNWLSPFIAGGAKDKWVEH